MQGKAEFCLKRMGEIMDRLPYDSTSDKHNRIWFATIAKQILEEWMANNETSC